MANTKSIKKVLDYLQTKKEAVSPSEISVEVMLKYQTIQEVLEILKMNQQIMILSTGKHTLVKFQGDSNAKGI